MSTRTKVIGFLAALAVLFGAGFAGGRLFDDGTSSATTPTPATTPATTGDGHDHAATSTAGEDGLASQAGSYALVLTSDRSAAGRAVPLSFAIRGPGGKPQTRYVVRHEKLLHLIVVRRDLSGFQHVHPELAPDGTWSTTVALEPGSWRVFADFQPDGGAPMVLGGDLEVSGRYRPAPDAPDSRTSEVDGYQVRLTGDLLDGATTLLTPVITKDGKPVTDLQPYLGALGHLVILRRGDLAYLHVHPDGLVFHASVPTPGSYALYLDFKHDGRVHTAKFTLTVEPSAPVAMPGSSPTTEMSHAGH